MPSWRVGGCHYVLEGNAKPMRNQPEPELEEAECVDAQGISRPEHDFPTDSSECRRCYAEVMPEESEE